MALDKTDIEAISESIAEAVFALQEATAKIVEQQIASQICLQVLLGVLLKYLGQSQGWEIHDFEAFIDEAVEGIENANFIGLSPEAAGEQRKRAIEQMRGMMSFGQS